MSQAAKPSHDFYEAFPHLTPEYFKGIAEAMRTPLPQTLPHYHSPGEQACTNRACLRDTSHQDHHCRMIGDLGSTHCYDEKGDFRCRSKTEGNKPCHRRIHSRQQ